ncbi:MAG: hypothetical protein ABL998_02570 [Planctomycetota bacterium]
MKTSSLAPLLLLFLGACASSAALRTVPAPTPEAEALFARVKALEGTWELTDEQGARQVASVFSVSSQGSVVREVMFPGAEHEMTNVYHLDGPSLVMTHYCASGNQPRLLAEAVDAATLAFHLDSVTNLTAADAAYMGALTLVCETPDRLRAEWKTFQDGRVVTEHSPVFVLTRKP